MGLVPPTKSSGKFVTIPHWQRKWIDNHNAINFSGLIQELLIEVIKTHDPAYFKQYNKYVDIQPIRKKEIIDRIVETTPIMTKLG